MKKIIFYNLLFLILLFFATEICSYIVLSIRYKNDEDLPLKYHLMKHRKIENFGFRPIEYGNPEKGSVLLFGCSYAYGHDLKENQTFSKKLADMTERTVINRAAPAEGPAFMYFQLINTEIIKNIKNIFNEKNINENVKYIIYEYIPGHKIRNEHYRYNLNSEFFKIRYKLKNDKLIYYKPFFPLSHSLFSVIFLEEAQQLKTLRNEEYLKLMTVKLLRESYKLAKQHFPKAKFIILYLPDGQGDVNECVNEEKNLLNSVSNDIKVFAYSDLFPQIGEDKYWLPYDKTHPSALFWEEFTPVLVNALNLTNED